MLRLEFSVALLVLVITLVAGCAETKDEDGTTTASTPTKSSNAASSTEPNTQDDMPPSYPAAESTNGEFVELSFNDFTSFPPEGSSSWTITDGVWKTSGVPKGYFASRKTFGDFTLRYEYRFPKLKSDENLTDYAGNTGCLVYIDRSDKIWPICLEVQGKFPETGSIKVNGRKDLTVEVEEFPDVRQEKLNPPGEWNQIEIVSASGALTVRLNGELISQSQPTERTSGRIAFQAENYEVEFRNLTIQVP
ncbi:MAG: DUF1080 domain-containing protein [Planctomycetaceae bacterium]